MFVSSSIRSSFHLSVPSTVHPFVCLLSIYRSLLSSCPSIDPYYPVVHASLSILSSVCPHAQPSCLSIHPFIFLFCPFILIFFFSIPSSYLSHLSSFHPYFCVISSHILISLSSLYPFLCQSHLSIHISVSSIISVFVYCLFVYCLSCQPLGLSVCLTLALPSKRFPFHF